MAWDLNFIAINNRSSWKMAMLVYLVTHGQYMATVELPKQSWVLFIRTRGPKLEVYIICLFTESICWELLPFLQPLPTKGHSTSLSLQLVLTSEKALFPPNVTCAFTYLLPTTIPLFSWGPRFCLIYLWLSPGHQDGARYTGSGAGLPESGTGCSM